MKKWIIAAALLVVASLQVDAQQRKGQQPNPEDRAKKMTEKMATELNLSDDQKAQVLALNLDQAQKRQAAVDQAAAERKARKTEMEAHQQKVNAVLTEEQRTKWDEIKIEQRAKWQEIRSEQRDKRRPGGEVHRRGDIPRHKRGN